jgi:hypothetical protein
MKSYGDFKYEFLKCYLLKKTSGTGGGAHLGDTQLSADRDDAAHACGLESCPYLHKYLDAGWRVRVTCDHSSKHISNNRFRDDWAWDECVRILTCKVKETQCPERCRRMLLHLQLSPRYIVAGAVVAGLPVTSILFTHDHPSVGRVPETSRPTSPSHPLCRLAAQSPCPPPARALTRARAVLRTAAAAVEAGCTRRLSSAASPLYFGTAVTVSVLALFTAYGRPPGAAITRGSDDRAAGVSPRQDDEGFNVESVWYKLGAPA